MSKRVVKIGAIILGVSALLPSVASADGALCQHKATEIRQQLEHAREQGNQHRIEGLQRALEAIENDCTNESVLDDATDEVRASLAEVQERQADFEEALNSGDEDNIRKRRIKLEEATLELEEHTEQLNALQGQLNR